MNKFIFYTFVITFFLSVSLFGQTNNRKIKVGCEKTNYIEEFNYPILLDKQDVYILSYKNINYEDEEFECSDSETNYLEQGIAPIVLYSTDIYNLKITEIEIKDTVKAVKEDFPYTFSIYFNEEGLLNNFSLYSVIDKKTERLSCSVKYSCLPYVDYDGPWYWSCFSKPRTHFILNEDYSYYSSEDSLLSVSDSFGDIQLDFQASLFMDNDDDFQCLSKIKILPLFGTNGYMYIDTLKGGKYFLNGNIINYNLIGTKYDITYNEWLGRISAEKHYTNYGILRNIQSDTVNVELYEVGNEKFFTPWVSKKTINQINKDTVNTQFYYYGDNPYSTHHSDRSSCIDEGIVVTYYYNTDYVDNIYNENRWLGIVTDEEYVLYDGVRSWRDCEVEAKVINETFENQNITYVSKKDFLINGQNGYDYLLEAYNNQQVLVRKEYEDKDENGNFLPAQYKLQKEIVEIKELPDKIIVQLTLTDFWYIQLTE